MTDPWKTLGLAPGASQDEIKKAYRELAKKYHPDRYVNSPMQAEAEQKMKEINEAYDLLTRDGGSTSYTESTRSGEDPTSLYYIRRLIDMGNLAAAEQLLDGMQIRSAEWYYLRGVIYLKKGWFVEGRTCINRAVSMDPDNEDYMAAYDELNGTTQRYRHQSHTQAAQSSGGWGRICSGCAGLCFLQWILNLFCLRC